jgi:hypothetical protein
MGIFHGFHPLMRKITGCSLPMNKVVDVYGAAVSFLPLIMMIEN